MTKNPTRKPISPPTVLDIFLIMLCALIWASAFVAISIAVKEFDPIMVATSRVTIGFIFLISYVLVLPFLAKRTNWPSGRNNWLKLGIIALLYTAVPFSLISWGQQYISATLTSIIMGSSPLIGYLIAHFATRDEKLNSMKILALGLGLVSIYFATDFSNSTDDTSSIWSIVAILAALVCYSISGTITRTITNGSTENLSAAVLGLGTIALLPALWLTGQYPSDFGSISSDAIWAIIYLGVFPTGLAYLIRFYLILKIGYTAFLTTIFFIPVFGVLLSAILLGEPLTINTFYALALIVASLIISRIGAKMAAKSLQKE
ncbi:MAG: DMT family transporter [Rhizobiales bacterium]|nr:DMT family transporter [Hyphomicrobiales bacterium]NRB15747.1 DMT family transporter [Hyphomicrobiales bacterium]